MAEKQSLDEKLINEMSEIAGLSSGLNSYPDSSIDERADILMSTAGVIGGKERFKDVYKELEVSDNTHYTKTQQALSERARDIQKDYAENKDAIISEVEANLNKLLEKAKSNPDALQALVPIFRNLMRIPKPSQSEADAIKEQELSKLLRMPLMTQVRGSPEEAQNLMYKTAIAEGEYITELRYDKGTSYKINRDNLAKLMENPLMGSILYKVTQPKKSK